VFNRFRKDSDELDGGQSPQEWLDVEESFDPRRVGKERGGWESFRDDSLGDTTAFDPHSVYEEDADDGRWRGGAYSRDRYTADVEDEGRRSSARADDALESIYNFRNPQFNTEIWFVALGSEYRHHDGAKAFLNEHHSELRGAMFIEIDGLGAGELSMIGREGLYKKTTLSSRMKRYAQKAANALGVPLGTAMLDTSDSFTSIAHEHGFQAVHIAGMEGGRIALEGSMKDVLENVDEGLLEENALFVLEMLKQV
jgi:hypothetical protein